jgi:hypothetical protein
MKATTRHIPVIILLAVLSVPSLAGARTPARHDIGTQRARVAAAASSNGYFSSVWNLLSNFMKTGIGLDPSGSPHPAPAGSTTSDTGTQLDPSGVPH